MTKRKRKNATPSAPMKKRARVEENEDESEEDCDDGAFVCVFEGCGKSFNREGKLADHLRTHTGERMRQAIHAQSPPEAPRAVAHGR
ncbi:zinc finger domain containing protein [Acanthamoeba castellanii str. Neff]|uniref:Zinc finger domain containing protein n=1 Tax=Acanthamoeba castellanii (strain ATCC 30010 / Neff) TaxID=1257118 RepID=L8HMQ2_ACACF|nr:zinc finger domain containing protein [Acanthamoeba castellanii str. Neff]ELR25661.1 zinc finger domain containing protein [Acanthamoeba castellanii str. Neff]